MLNLIEKYRRSIKTFNISQYDLESNTYRLKMQITFIDESNLVIKEYLFKNGERKYAYHWSDKSGNLICRWDNAKHWMDISTFPHHKHVGSEVVETTETTLENVLFSICGTGLPSRDE
jgi:hypothetical protein